MLVMQIAPGLILKIFTYAAQESLTACYFSKVYFSANARVAEEKADVKESGNMRFVCENQCHRL